MKSYLAILLIPPLIPTLCVIHTVFSQTSYEIQTCYNNRQTDFVVAEGDLFVITYLETRGVSKINFYHRDYWGNWNNTAQPHFRLLFGSRPDFDIIPATPNTAAQPGSRIFSIRFPMWLISSLLLIPFFHYSLKYRRRLRNEQS
ncbi:MAG: hypothetical protein P1U89_19000 [Verrucomicrobiales bacterium]|nr:hypothetical protein [Verrucomicrobiales bacterium]